MANKPQNTIRKNTFHSQQYLTFWENPDELISKILEYHPFLHSIEILTNNQILEIPQLSEEYYHVLLKTNALKDPSVAADLFNPNTSFHSLSPIDSGNYFAAINGNLVFSLNQATYQRFGLVGRKFKDDLHIISISPENVDQLQRIRKSEPIEGILSTQNYGLYSEYILKMVPSPPLITQWSPAQPLNFDLNSLKNPDQLPPEWWENLLDAFDQSLLTKSTIIPDNSTNCHRISISGVIKTSEIENWIRSIVGEGENNFALIMLWDLHDIPASYVGNKLTLEGFGGGCETLLIGNNLPKAIKYQCVEYLHDE